MLAKVLKDSDTNVTPVPWLSCEATPIQTSGHALQQSERDDTSEMRRKVAELTASAETQSREAYQAGYQAGESASRQALELEFRQAIERLANAVTEIAELRSGTIQRAEADTVRLAIEIARRILHRELAVDSSALEALIKAALEKLQSQELYRVRVHPDQAKVVRSCLDHMGRGQGIEVIKDASQPKGAALFEIARGALDASVETQLREIEAGLADRLELRG